MGSDSDTPAFADERQARIAEYVATRGRARISELTPLFGVTDVTIRKDLQALQERGVLKRTHGGALALTQLVERELASRVERNPEAKAAIGRRCVEMISAGDAIYLDNGTSVDAIVRQLFAPGAQVPRDLSILTNTVDVAEMAAGASGVEHVLLGGALRPSSRSLVGPTALRALERFTVDTAFIGVSGFSEAGVSVGNVAEAEVKAAVIANARRVVVPLDHTKVGATDFALVCGLDDVDVVVMDRRTPAIQELCAAHGVELVEVD